jgi:hypothetical protein
LSEGVKENKVDKEIRELLRPCLMLARRLYGIDPSLKVFALPDEKRGACLMDVSDERLDEVISKGGGTPGAWSSRPSLLIGKDMSVLEGDIPINMLSLTKERRPWIDKLEIPEGCKVDGLHIHDWGSPAVHVHIKCDPKAYPKLADLISKAMEISRLMAG